MDKYIFDNRNGLLYELNGDYYIPCLTLPAGTEQPIGIWGQRHLRYLNEYHKATHKSAHKRKTPCRNRRTGKGYVLSAGKGLCQ